MAQMNGMEKRNFTNSARNSRKTVEMRNNSTISGMAGMSVIIGRSKLQTITCVDESLLQNYVIMCGRDCNLQCQLWIQVQ